MNAFLKDESGVTAIEYALIAALVAVGLIVALTILGDSLSANFEEVASHLSAGGGGGPSPT